MRTPPNPADLCDVYIDESSQSGHRYLVLGAVVVRTLAVRALVDEIWKRRKPELPAGELKWGKVSTAKLAAYTRVVDTFFDIAAAQFHCLVVNTAKQKHAVFNHGSREIGFSKEIYQLAMKCGRIYPFLFHVYPDRRTVPLPMVDLRTILNRGIKNKGDKRDWPYRRLQFRDSAATELLQMADLLAGAMAYRLNGHHAKRGASQAKNALSAHVLKRAKITDPFRDTALSGKFTVWHRRLK